jgi:DNA-binding PadR family transcriptional regulator
MKKNFLGEFEQMVLLAILQMGTVAFSLEIRQELEESAGRRVSRGAFYTTLDRLEAKGLVTWSMEVPSGSRRDTPQRLFEVTEDGVAALRASKSALNRLWRNLGHVLGES